MFELPDYMIEELGTNNVPEFNPDEIKEPELPAQIPVEVLPATVDQHVISVEGITYTATSDRLYQLMTKGDKTYPLFVSSLIVVVASARDHSSSNWGKIVRFNDQDGMLKQVFLRNSDITTNGNAVVKALVDEGLQLSTDRRMIDALLHYLNLVQPVEGKAICSDRIGWHDNSYLFHDSSVIGDSETRFVYTGSSISNRNTIKGTPEEWKDHVASLCKGNSMLILSVCIAFASVLLRHLKIESGGFHIFGESSTGKSTTLYVAASVHGEPEHLMGTWRSTTNGAEGRAKKFNDATMINDELHQSTPKEAGEAVYMIMNGKGKQRSSVLGDAREVFEWRLNCLSSGEISCASFIQEGGRNSRAGQAVRMLDLTADMGLGMGIFENIHGSKDSHSFAELLKKQSSSYYGTPIRAFLENLVGDLDQLEETFSTVKGKFFTRFVPAESTGQVQRVASKLAVAALAGELATSMGLTGWGPEEAFNAIGSCFTRWLAGRGTTGQQEAENAVEQTKNFLLRHGMSRFIPMKIQAGKYVLEHPDRQYSDMAGFRLKNSDDKLEFIVFPKVFTDEMCLGLNNQYVIKTLKERSFIAVGADGKAQVRHRLPGMGQMRVYHFNSSIFEDADEFEDVEPDETEEQH